MKESKILKAVSFVSMLILIPILILSIFIISVISVKDEYYSEEKYYNSSEFVSNYMFYLGNNIYYLIHDDIDYQSVKDENMDIHYITNENGSNFNITNGYFLMIYKNKALTNVELTNNTNTIESIKTYIKNGDNAKCVNIIHGEIESQSNIVQTKGIKYLDNFKEQYFVISGDKKENFLAEAKDFEIYSSYVEKFNDNSEQKVMQTFIEKVSPYEEHVYMAIPICVTIIVLILIYLIISLGYRKGVEGISLNDIDKIPLEIIIFITILISVIPFIIFSEIHRNYNVAISLMLTSYFLIYISYAITFSTIIKRIKSRTFLKSSIVGRILMLIADMLKWLYHTYVSIFNTITYSTKISFKVFIYFGIVIPIAIFIYFISINDIGMAVVLQFILLTIVTYRILKTTKGYAQIENKLKEMYEGNNKTLLKKEEFGPEFQRSVKYINDISNGFENAIQDRTKGERLKAELITNVSHDIKTPLTSIINYVDLLKQEDIKNEKAKEYIEILENKSQRLKKLTEDLIEASKVSTGNITLNLENINVVQLFKQALGEFEDRFKKRGLEIILDSKESEIFISADNKYMYRIVENLFSNISKYALENSRVYIDINKMQKNVKIEMKNISKDRLNITADELMQRFVRGDKARITEGSGLGISIAQNLTELQGGNFKLILDGDLFKVELEWKRI